MQTYAEQKAAFEARLKANGERQKAIMDAAATEGRTLDASEQEEFDTLVDDDKEIAKHVGRLDALIAREEADKKTAKAVDGSTSGNGSTTRGGEPIVIKRQPKLEPGIALARLAKSLGMGQGIMGEAANIARRRYGEDSDAFGVLKTLAERGERLAYAGVEKANVVGGANVSGNWAEDLVGDETSAFADFVEFLRPMTILGKFGANGVPSLRRVPFRVALVSQTAGGEGYWVGEGKPKPLTSFDFSRTTLTPLKVANIAVLTDEIIRDSSPSAEAIVRDALAAALRERIDEDFIDPANSGTSNVKPAAITNGMTGDQSVAASGTGDADDVRLDIRSLLQKYINANNPPSSGVLIMRSGDALALSLMVNALGQQEFNGISMNGGTLLGIPVITSEYVPSGYVVMVNASDIYFADEGGIEIDLSREASLQMLDNPTNDVVTPTPTTMVSMFQTNSVAFRAERALNWARRRDSAVALLTGVAWGGTVST
jgi:hypothetical protein